MRVASVAPTMRVGVLVWWCGGAIGWQLRASWPSYSRRGVVVGSSEGDSTLPSVEEALAGAEAYEGPGIVDPYYMHPNTFPMLHEWTAEDFGVDYEVGDYAEWVIPKEAFVFLRFLEPSDRASSLREALHLEHLFWCRESGVRAKRAGGGGPEVYASQSVFDDAGQHVVASLVAITGGTEASARALMALDPLARAGTVFAADREVAYHWTIADDPYLQMDVWPSDCSPFVSLRLDDPAGTAKRAETREKHLSFLRKTRRTIRAGPLRPLDGSQAVGTGAPCGSLVYAFHSSKEGFDDWADADPYVEAGVFGAAPIVASTYCDFDVTGRQLTRPPPLNELPDPLLAMLVDANLVQLEERQVERIDTDPDTGEIVRYNITTNDPRVLSNVQIDDEMMAAAGSTPKAIRAKRAREKKEAEDDAMAALAQEEEALDAED